MKTLQQICMAVVLTLMLATGAFAGIIHTPAPPPPDSETTPGVTSTAVDAQGSGTSSCSGTEVALYLLQSLMLVF